MVAELAGVRVAQPDVVPDAKRVLTPGALDLVARLQRRFGARREELLGLRRARLNAGERPAFLPETLAIREGSWRIGTVPHDLQDRRVEITGPTDRKMTINPLNS